MSDVSDIDGDDYVSVEDREQIISDAIDAAETLIRRNMPYAWEFITSDEEKAGDSDDPPGGPMAVIRAFKRFCREPTSSIYEDALSENIVDGLVGSSLETQYKLEEFIWEYKLNSPFWTSLIQELKDRYEEEEERLEQEREREYQEEQARRRLIRRASGQMGRSGKRTRRVSSVVLRF